MSDSLPLSTVRCDVSFMSNVMAAHHPLFQHRNHDVSVNCRKPKRNKSRDGTATNAFAVGRRARALASRSTTSSHTTWVGKPVWRTHRRFAACNRDKKLNELNFLQTASPLAAERDLELLSRSGREDVAYSLTRLVNSFYRCQAVCHLRIHQRLSNGQFYSKWQIELFSGNDPKWLSKHKKALLKHVQEDFGCDWVTEIKIVGST